MGCTLYPMVNELQLATQKPKNSKIKNNRKNRIHEENAKRKTNKQEVQDKSKKKDRLTSTFKRHAIYHLPSSPLLLSSRGLMIILTIRPS